MHISKHHYAKELAKKGNNVYFFSPPSLKAKLFSVEKINPNLKVINYYPIFRGKSVLPTPIFNLLIKLQILFLIKKIGIKPDIVWSFTSTLYFNLNWFKAKFSIYHPVDQLNDIEAVNIGKSANIIFTCSEYILEELKPLNKPKHIINHGISPAFIDHKFKRDTTVKQVNVGYVGNLFMRNLDRKNLQSIISKNPTHHFNFYGAYDPEKSNVSAWVRPESLAFISFLKQCKNVTLHGSVSSENIPKKIEINNVFLVCYKVDKENIISNSHKILEYLSTGKVIISTYIHHYNNSNLLEMCPINSNSNYVNLYHKITQDLQNYNTEACQLERRNAALNNTYTNKVIEIEQLIINLGFNNSSNNQN